MTEPELSKQRESAFATLVDVVREWRSAGRVTTSAGVKPAFVQATQGKNEQDYGFGTWREFVEAAAEAGHVRTERLATNHTGILLPDENLAVTTAKLEQGHKRDDSNTSLARSRFKSDVWAAFVEWHDGHRRLWDSRTSRAFVYPVDEHDEPTWVSQPDRFRAIEPVTPEAQKEWMRAWALRQPPADRAALLAALAPDAPLRSFRHVLDSRGLALEWRAELQNKVGAHVRAWADQHAVAWHDLTTPLPPERSSASSSSPTYRAANKNVRPASTSETRDARAAGGSDLERLREIVHRAIDRMSYAELADIPIRAEHLLGDL
ncbi:hypothetical protein F9278_31905 [Streptomyces phaeolivaceus]|uniref:Uncharacterized protein n=1 Tax=Streptomyces phaeolivaceus TaxID=2653200 RepID=A0A5P8K9T4_9ACTN|nr:hypothetical protein [Streptomyces phaeolivaceus]QFR00006.1 hypothetical protein F9278_31905 [Streptomyces phaeolivaceus]